jgi:hypothetical protein
MVGSLGEARVTFPGVLVRATVNQTDPAARIAAQSIEFQVLPGNAGVVRICLAGSDMPGTSANELVLHTLPKPASATTGPFDTWRVGVFNVPSAVNPADFYIDADNIGDGVLVTYTNQ